ncbi:MAG: L,D-transpeptidase family protein [Deltaproteobacteria bacterium]|nr:L,D-transpeptidase family protein [Deltaproteobacteria bacterium]
MFLRILGIFLVSGVLSAASSAWGAGPFHYRLPRGSGLDPEAVTVVGQPQKHHIVRYENMYKIARQYDLGFWELARYHRQLDHFYLPWETDIDIPSQWIIPERSSYPGYLINVAELRGYRFFPEKGEVRTYPIGIGVLDYKTPIGQRFRVQSKSVNPGWRIPKGLQAKYGMAYMPPGEDCPVGSRWMGLSHYGLHGTHAPMGVGRLVSHGCIRHYPEDIEQLFDITSVGTPVELIYEPVKFGFLKGRVFVEVHEDIYHKIPDLLKYAVTRLSNRGLAGQINWTKFLRAVEERNGAPVDITR